MSELRIRKAMEKDLPAIANLTIAWEQEDITFGLQRDTVEDLAAWRIWVAEREGQITGFLAGHSARTRERTSVMPADEPYFEIEELYVCANERRNGVGDLLFRHVETILREEGFRHIMLTTATKDAHAMLRFYEQKEDMRVWSMRLFKHL